MHMMMRAKVELEFSFESKDGDGREVAHALLEIVGDRILHEQRSSGTLYSSGCPIGRYTIETSPDEAPLVVREKPQSHG